MRSVFPTLQFIIEHPISSKSPMRAIWRFVKWQVKSRSNLEVITPWIEGTKIVARSGMTTASGNIYCGLFEFVDMAFVLHFLRKDDLFVDVGSNIGSYTILASAVCEARTISVEPAPDTMRSLTKNVAANGISSRVCLVEAALGATAGEAKFTVGKDAMNRIATGLEAEAETQTVQVRSLDEIVGNYVPRLIKIDVEGYEQMVIAGGAKTIDGGLQAILIETLDPEVRSRIEGAGFQLVTYEPFSRLLSPYLRERSGTRSQDSHNWLFVKDIDYCQHVVSTAPTRKIFGVWL